MEKYGVDTGESSKLASDGQTCPRCGGAVSHHGAVLLCPLCGSEPFEPPSAGRVAIPGNSTDSGDPQE